MALNTYRRALKVSLVSFLLVPGLRAAEISGVSGFFKSASSKTNGTSTGGASTFSLAARYSDLLEGSFHWFGQAGITLNNYSAASGAKAPSNSFGLALQGGVRLYFDPFSNRVIPYAAMRAGLVNQESYNALIDTQITQTGLYYYGDLGLRVDLDSDFFVDLEANLFKTALFAIEKSRKINGEEGSETEITRIGLYVDSSSTLLDSLTLGFGFKF